jgi:hypothetical protein
VIGPRGCQPDEVKTRAPRPALYFCEALSGELPKRWWLWVSPCVLTILFSRDRLQYSRRQTRRRTLYLFRRVLNCAGGVMQAFIYGMLKRSTGGLTLPQEHLSGLCVEVGCKGRSIYSVLSDDKCSNERVKKKSMPLATLFTVDFGLIWRPMKNISFLADLIPQALLAPTWPQHHQKFPRHTTCPIRHNMDYRKSDLNFLF